MPDSGNSIGEIYVQITGDYSGLEVALKEAETIASEGASAISSAFTITDFSDLATSASQIEEALKGVTDSAGQTQEAIEALTGRQEQAREVYNQAVAVYNTLNDSIQSGIPLASGAAATTEELTRAQNELAKAAKQAGVDLGTSAHSGSAAFHELSEAGGEMLRTLGELAALAGVSTGLAEIASKAIEAYNAIQLANISLTAMSGSAQFAAERIEELKNISQSNALDFPSLVQAQQKMTAFGFSAKESAAFLQDAADAAKATGNSFDAVSNSLDRIAQSGQVSGRFLIQLGLNIHDLAEVMGVADDKVSKLFEHMDVSGRILVLSEAMEKFAGVAALSADTVAGHWQQFQNTLDFAFEDIGQTIAPVINSIIGGLNSLVPVITDVSTAFLSEGIGAISGYVSSLKDLAEGVQSVEELFGVDFREKVGGASTTLKQFASDVIENVLHLEELKKVYTDLAILLDRFSSSTKAADATMRSSFANQQDALRKETEAYVNVNGMLDQYAEKQKNARDEAIKTAIARAQAAIDAKNHMIDLLATEDAIIERTSKLAGTSGELGLISSPIKALENAANDLNGIWSTVDSSFEKFRDNAAAGFNFNKLYDDLSALKKKMEEAGDTTSFAYQTVSQNLESLGQDITDSFYGLDKLQAKLEETSEKGLEKFGDSIQKAARESLDAKNSLDPLTRAVADLGLTFEGLTKQEQKAVTDFNEIATSNTQNIQLIDGAWAKVQSTIQKLANDPSGLPKALQMEQEYLAALDHAGAPLQRQLALEVQIAEASLKGAESNSNNAKYILQVGENLEIAKSKQNAFNDALNGELNLFKGVEKAFSDAYTEFGNGIADAIAGTESFGQAFTKMVADLEKKLAELVVNFLLGQLKDAILADTNALGDFAKLFNSLFGISTNVTSGGSGGGAVGSATGAAGAAAQGGFSASSVGSALSSTMDVLTGILNVLNGIIQDFEIAHIEKQLAVIEGETRRIANATEISTNAIHDMLGYVQQSYDFLWNPLAQYLQNFNVDLDLLVSGGGSLGNGGGGGGSNSTSVPVSNDSVNPNYSISNDSSLMNTLNASAQSVSNLGNAALSTASALPDIASKLAHPDASFAKGGAVEFIPGMAEGFAAFRNLQVPEGSFAKGGSAEFIPGMAEGFAAFRNLQVPEGSFSGVHFYSPQTGLIEPDPVYQGSNGLPSSVLSNQSGAALPSSITVMVTGNSIYGTDGAQMISQQIVNTLKTAAGQKLF